MCFEDSGPQFAIANFTGRRPLVAAGADDGLFDFPARQYSAYQGRWLTPDPAGLAAVDPASPQTWNEYAYVGNQPLSATDPLGLASAPPQTSDVCAAMGQEETCDLELTLQPDYWQQFVQNVLALIRDDAEFDGVGTGQWYAPWGPFGPNGGAPAAAAAPAQAAVPPAPAKKFTCGGPNAPLVPLSTRNLSFDEERPRSRVILLLSPAVAAAFRKALAQLNAMGVAPMIDSAFRTVAMQKEDDPAVPNSAHEAGDAIDINHNTVQFAAIRSVMEANGFKWGGSFRTPDPVHFYIGPPSSSPRAIGAAQSYLNDCY